MYQVDPTYTASDLKWHYKSKATVDIKQLQLPRHLYKHSIVDFINQHCHTLVLSDDGNTAWLSDSLMRHLCSHTLMARLVAELATTLQKAMDDKCRNSLPINKAYHLASSYQRVYMEVSSVAHVLHRLSDMLALLALILE